MIADLSDAYLFATLTQLAESQQRVRVVVASKSFPELVQNVRIGYPFRKTSGGVPYGQWRLRFTKKALNAPWLLSPYEGVLRIESSVAKRTKDGQPYYPVLWAPKPFVSAADGSLDMSATLSKLFGK